MTHNSVLAIDQLELLLRQGRDSWILVARCYRQVVEGQEYLSRGFSTFDEYVKDLHSRSLIDHASRRQAYYLVSCAKFLDKLKKDFRDKFDECALEKWTAECGQTKFLLLKQLADNIYSGCSIVIVFWLKYLASHERFGVLSFQRAYVSQISGKLWLQELERSSIDYDTFEKKVDVELSTQKKLDVAGRFVVAASDTGQIQQTYEARLNFRHESLVNIFKSKILQKSYPGYQILDTDVRIPFADGSGFVLDLIAYNSSTRSYLIVECKTHSDQRIFDQLTYYPSVANRYLAELQSIVDKGGPNGILPIRVTTCLVISKSSWNEKLQLLCKENQVVPHLVEDTIEIFTLDLSSEQELQREALRA